MSNTNPLLGTNAPGKHHWKVQLQSDDGQIFERDAYVSWSPVKDGAMELVMSAVQGEEGARLSREKKRCVAVTAVLVED